MIPLRYWFFLLLSILLEVGGTSLMKLSQSLPGSWPALGLGLMYLLLGLSYFFLARAVLRLPLGVAYAFWEGLGLALISLVSVFAVGESMTPVKLLALVMVLAGTMLVHHGTGHGTVEAGPEAGDGGPESPHAALPARGLPGPACEGRPS